MFDVVHRAAGDGAFVLVGLGGDFPVSLGQRHLGELGCRAEQCGHPHPEKGARPAVVDGPGRASDVTDTDRGRQRGGQGLEMRNVSRFVRVVVAARGYREAVRQVSQLYESEPDGQKETSPQQGDHLERNHLFADRDAEAVDVELDRLDDLLEEVHGCPAKTVPTPWRLHDAAERL